MNHDFAFYGAIIIFILVYIHHSTSLCLSPVFLKFKRNATRTLKPIKQNHRGVEKIEKKHFEPRRYEDYEE